MFQLQPICMHAMPTVQWMVREREPPPPLWMKILRPKGLKSFLGSFLRNKSGSATEHEVMIIN